MQRNVSNIPPSNAAPDKNDVVEMPVQGPDEDDVFYIPPKNAPLAKLRNWRGATLALNKSRRFRYTLDLKRAKERGRDSWKSHTQAVRAATRFRLNRTQEGMRYEEGLLPELEAPQEGYGIGPITLAILVREQHIDALKQKGGVNGVANLLHTDIKKGIKEEPKEFESRRNAFGENTYPRKAARNFFVFVWEACRDKTLIVLMICAALSLALRINSEGIKEGRFNGGSLIFAVIFVVLVKAIVDYREHLWFQNLNEEKRTIQVQVIRGGRRCKVSIFNLVVGDVVHLNIGDQVPADGILITGHSLSIDESSMTGESKFVGKDQKDPFMLSGCKVADGYGTMLITGVGLNTEWGVLMASISEDNWEETPLLVRLNGVATLIGKVGLTVAFVVFVIFLIRFFTGHAEDNNGNPMFHAGKTKVGDAIDGIVKIFAIVVIIVIVAVPEGLPLAVTLNLAYSMTKMMADKALVRRFSSCEIMGSATTICCGKTGILTLNEMAVVRACIAGRNGEPPDSSETLPSVVYSLLIEGISQNTTGSVFKPEGHGETEVTGSPTEKAILLWALKLGMDFDDERSKSCILHVFTFNSEKKRGGVALKKSETEIYIHWKGAAEIILGLCNTWIDSAGSVQEMTPDTADEFSKIIKEMAAATLRCIAFAYKTYDPDSVPADEEQPQSWQNIEENLTLLAIVGMKDPFRPNVNDSVNMLKKADVKVCMVTGDNIYTAEAIARECGILQAGDQIEHAIIEGRDFRNYSEKEKLEIVDKICVMGRSSPTDKLLLVQALKKKGRVVAVTGDGTNDVPALKEADIRLSMGIQGTEVAKESSDIIILDDNFASIVKVVQWGRSVYASIQKVFQYQLTGNVAAIVINFVSVVSSRDVPLTDVQLLWVNLIMDTLGTFALATEPPTDDLMQRSPVRLREPLITNIMWTNIIVQGLYQVTVLLILTFEGNGILNLKHDNKGHADKVRNTVIFNAFVFCQIFNEFNSRKPEKMNILRGLCSSRSFIGILSFKFALQAFTLVLQVLIVEFAGKIASTTSLDWKKWIICIVIGFISWPLAAIAKFIPVPETPFVDYFSRRKASSEHRSFSDSIAEVNREQSHHIIEIT